MSIADGGAESRRKLSWSEYPAVWRQPLRLRFACGVGWLGAARCHALSRAFLRLAPSEAAIICPAMSATSAMLETPEVRARISPMTVAQYGEFPEFNEKGRRTELIRGVVLEKTSKSPLHSSIAGRLYRLLQAALPTDFTLLREDPLTLADSEPEPDLAIVRGREEDFADRHPSTAVLVIEIAVSCAAEDRSLAALYAEAGVEEYCSSCRPNVASKSTAPRNPAAIATTGSWKAMPPWSARASPASASNSRSCSVEWSGYDLTIVSFDPSVLLCIS